MNIEEYSQRLEKCYTGVVNDVMRGMGLKNYILPTYFDELFMCFRLEFSLDVTISKLFKLLFLLLKSI